MAFKNRTCRVCGEHKTMENFQEHGYQCRSCRTEKQRINWASLSEDEKRKRQKNGKYQKEYAKKNSEKIKRVSRETHLKRKFNITTEQYETMLNNQGGVCYICQNLCDTGFFLAVDHDHNTGIIRGLLCKNCNSGLGMFKDNQESMRRAIEYLNVNQFEKRNVDNHGRS